jgi:CDP-glucose 4,6-dehydratase
MGGLDPYSSSKACSELVTAAYRNSFFNVSPPGRQQVAVASARAGNVIGGGDWAADRLVPDILRAFERNEPVVIRSPYATRPWQHVLEPLSGYLTLAQKLYEDGQVYAEGWNFGPNDDDAKPVQWIVEELVKDWGRGASWQLDAGQHPHEANYLKLDISKAKSKLGWAPRWNLTKALSEITAWHHALLEGKDMQEKCIYQIERFTTS